MIETKFIGSQERESYQGSTEVVIYQKVAFERRAEMVCELLCRWGMVAGVQDGEDSQGRSKIRLSTPEELVARAFEVTSLFMDEVECRGWFIDLPTPKMVNKSKA